MALGRALTNAGLSHIPGFQDPTARVFLSEKGKRKLAEIEAAWAAGKRSRRAEMSRVMADMIGLRTAAIDAAAREAVGRGIKQLVILGAGYDGRAWRLPELAGVTVFEVDHPATQEQKRKRVAELPRPAATVKFVSMNFEHEWLDEVLDRAGYDRLSPTCWIWEGVVMYLTVDAMRATLRHVAECSAPGSALILNYHDEHRQWFAKLVFWLIGEPQISAWTRDEMAAELSQAGFRVQQDSGMMDWNARFAGGEGQVQRAAYMRVVVATK